MMKGGHDSHRGRLSPAHLLAHLIAPCLCPRTLATAETLCRGGSAVAPAAEALRKTGSTVTVTSPMAGGGELT